MSDHEDIVCRIIGRTFTPEEAARIKDEIDMRTYRVESDARALRSLETWLDTGNTATFEWSRGRKRFRVRRA